VPKFPPGPQEVPLYSSVLANPAPALPPNAKPAVCVPAPPSLLLAVAKAPPAVQELPLYSSVAVESGGA
jgi:hypothetical protein